MQDFEGDQLVIAQNINPNFDNKPDIKARKDNKIMNATVKIQDINEDKINLQSLRKKGGYSTTPQKPIRYSGGYSSPASSSIGGYSVSAGAAGAVAAVASTLIPIVTPLVMDGIKWITNKIKNKVEARKSGNGLNLLDKRQYDIMNQLDSEMYRDIPNIKSGSMFYRKLIEKVKSGLHKSIPKVTNLNGSIVTKLADEYIKKRVGSGIIGDQKTYRSLMKNKIGSGIAEDLKYGNLMYPVVKGHITAKLRGKIPKDLLDDLVDGVMSANDNITEESVVTGEGIKDVIKNIAHKSKDLIKQFVKSDFAKQLYSKGRELGKNFIEQGLNKAADTLIDKVSDTGVIKNISDKTGINVKDTMSGLKKAGIDKIVKTYESELPEQINDEFIDKQYERGRRLVDKVKDLKDKREDVTIYEDNNIEDETTTTKGTGLKKKKHNQKLTGGWIIKIGRK